MDEPQRLGSRLLDACIAALLGAMALAGAVTIVEVIWVTLCVIVAVFGMLLLAAWLIARRLRGW